MARKTGTQKKRITPEPTGKKCYICGGEIDTSDTEKTWLTITRHAYSPTIDTLIPGEIPERTLEICYDCSFDVWADIVFQHRREVRFRERILEAMK